MDFGCPWQKPGVVVRQEETIHSIVFGQDFTIKKDLPCEGNIDPQTSYLRTDCLQCGSHRQFRKR